MKLIKYAETVEVPTNSTTKTKFYFKEQPNLRNKRIFFIDATYRDDASKSPSGLTPVSDTIFWKSFLVLVSKNKEIVNRIPIVQFWPTTQLVTHTFLDLIIDFPKSYIEVGSTAGLDANGTFLFIFYGNDVIKEMPEYRGINIENIEVETTPATIRKFHFPDHENLRNKKIQFIELSHYNLTMLPSGGPLANGNVEFKSYLTIASHGQEIIRKLPIRLLRSLSYYNYKINFDSIEIDLPNSYIEVADTEHTVAGEKFFLNVHFYDRIITKKN